MADPGALFTGYGIIITVLGFWFISTQISQGEQALSLTKSSVDAYVATEQGAVWLSNLKCVIGEKGRRVCHVALENVGRTAIEVMEIRMHGECIPKGSIPPRISAKGWDRSMYILLGPEKRIGTEKVEGLVSMFAPYEWSKKEVDERRTGKDYTFRITVMYKTAYGVTRRYGCTAVWEYGAKNFNSYPGHGYTFDVPVDLPPGVEYNAHKA